MLRRRISPLIRLLARFPRHFRYADAFMPFDVAITTPLFIIHAFHCRLLFSIFHFHFLCRCHYFRHAIFTLIRFRYCFSLRRHAMPPFSFSLPPFFFR